MKKNLPNFILMLIGMLLTANLLAQSPEKLSYQAVIRDAGNALVTNQTISMKISILQGVPNGPAVYEELHSKATNANGLFSTEIGTGTLLSGNFSSIDWANGPYFIKTETDPTGGSNYTISGTSQLISVPYALFAKQAETVTGELNETDPVFQNSEAANITVDDITNLSNLSGVNTGDQDISGIANNQQAIQDTAAQIRGDFPDVSGFLSEEADPIFQNSEAANISVDDITNLSNLSGVNTGDQDISGIASNQQAIQDTAAQIRGDFPDVSGLISEETDPVFQNSEAANITVDDITNLSNLSGVNTGDQDISGIASNQQAIQDTAAQIRGDFPDVSGFISEETDPVYQNSEAANITVDDITNLSNLSGVNTGDQDISGIASNQQAIQDTAAQIRGDFPDVSGFLSEETDPVFQNSEAANISVDDITNLSNLSGVNTGDQDISGIASNQQAIQDTAAQIRGDFPDVSGLISEETDPVFQNSEAANITVDDITNLSNLSGVNTGDQDISGIASNQQAIQDTAAQIRGDFPDVSGFLSEETDPVFQNSEAANISVDDITNLSNLSGVNTGDQDISGIASNQQAIQDTAAQIRGDFPDVSGFISEETDPRLPDGVQTGELQYWNGNSWVTLLPGYDGALLSIQNGIPKWVGGIPENITNPTTGKIWMDQNLGASLTASSSTDAQAFGDLFQWGRSNDGHEKRNSTTSSNLSSSDNPGNSSFIMVTSSPYDWRNPQNDQLWQGLNGFNNPCPPDYRIPTLAEWEAERQSWSSQNSAGAFASSLKITVAGYRTYNTAALTDVGSSGHYWTATVNGTGVNYLNINSSSIDIGSNNRANGLSVRCIKDTPGNPPVVATAALTAITKNSATTGGTVSEQGETPVIQRGVCWSTNPNPSLNDSHTSDGSGTGSFSSEITGLAANTTYYVRAYATNAVHTAYGEQLEFITEVGNLPTVTTAAVTDITTTATSGGNVTDEGDTPVTQRGVCWSTNPNPTIADSLTNDGSGAGEFISYLDGLDPVTTYYVRAYATNVAGTAYGEQQEFTTTDGSTTVVVEVLNPETNQIWMDRNLGASRAAISSNDEYAYGDLYQWGRGTDGHEKRNSVTTTTLSDSDNPGHGDFIAVQEEPYDWRSPQNDNLWQGVDGINNPCPEGFRIPTNTEWTAEYQSWSSQNTEGAYNSNLKLPAAGSRSGEIIFGGPEYYNNYWSSFTTPFIDLYGGKASVKFGFNNTGVIHPAADRSAGFSVRCIKDQPGNPPSITTAAATAVTPNTAEAGGEVTQMGDTPVSQKGVCWSTNPNPTINDSLTNDGTGTGSFTSTLTNLTANTSYYVRAYATNSGGTAYGEQLEFTTLVGDAPVINTVAVSEITKNSAISGGTITDEGDTPVTQKGVCWSTSPDPTLNDSISNDGAGSEDFTSTLSGLSVNTTYYVRTYAINAAGTAYGEEVEFTTLAGDFPTITTVAVTNVTTTATTGGNVTDEGDTPVTQRGVCWSTNPNPTIADSLTNDGSGAGEYVSQIVGLNPTTTYYVRAYAINAAGAAYGEQQEFTTTDGSTTVIEVINPLTNRIWMDRNLGASRAATSSTDAEAYGDLYQWGRLTDGHEKRNSGTTTTLSSSDTPGHGNFILLPTLISPYDWRNPQNNNLWQGVSGTNNPCPSGYRLPTEAELNAERQSWGSNNATGAFNSPLKLPVAGSRTSTGSLNSVGSTGYYSSATVDGTLSQYMYFGSSSADMNSGYRTAGTSVRCIKDQPGSEPLVTTATISAITKNSAISGGTITDEGDTPITQKGVCWSTNPNPTIDDSFTNDGTGTDSYTSTLSGLSVNTTYYVRAYAINAAGTAYGEEVEFTTLVGDFPTVTTADITDITGTTATSGGNVTAQGDTPVTQRGICWSTSPDPTIADNISIDGAGIGEYTSQLSGLNPLTTYYVRAYASNTAGTNYGEQISFTTTNPTTVVVEVTNPTTGHTWMDRNLGASRAATSSTDDQAYGNLYQWGRNTDGHEKRDSPTTSTLSSSDVPGHGNFILTPNSPNDWRSPQNNNLWQGVSGTNNPCPAGYRLPTEAEWIAEHQSWSSNNASGAYNSPLKLPVAGRRYGSTGSLGGIGARGGYWSNTLDSTGARYLYFSSSDALMGSHIRARGTSVRCIKDQPGNPPSVTTAAVTAITLNTAETGGDVTHMGDTPVSQKGVCWSTNQNPTINDSHTNDGSGIGSFTSTLTNLTANTSYYIRAYATNSGGTAYGEQVEFTTQVDYCEGVTPPTGYGVVSSSGKCWLDRNLGASRVAQSSTDSEAFGDLYQWGRLTDGHEKRTSGTTSTLSSSDVPGHGNFITVGSSSYDWRSPRNNNLWQGINGTNNPCPAGYRLPTSAEMQAELNSWSIGNAEGAFNSPLKLPVAGRRLGSDGSLSDVGSKCNYWLSTVSDRFVRHLHINYESSTGATGIYLHPFRSSGHSVRCIKD
jgi:uncharacterized protein (TIGR02145 family)